MQPYLLSSSKFKRAPNIFLIIKFVFFRFPAHFVTVANADFAHALGSAPIGCVIAGIIICSIVLFGCVGAYKEGSCLIGK